MFEGLTNKFNETFRQLSGRGRISEENVREAMRSVRTALLEADVNFKVVKDFCEVVVQKALGAEVIKSLKPDQMMVKIVHDELVALMGPVDPQIYYVSPGPTIIMMAGLQGSGKTTTTGKLAKFLLERDGKRPLMVANDLQRPAAIEQLITLGEQLDIPVYHEKDNKNPVAVARHAIRHANQHGEDVVLLDTAGRLHIDTELMDELGKVCDAVTPQQIFLVCDAMTGQDAVNSAKEFNDKLELDGVILTKLDGDARGGAALSVKAVTGKPIKFVGVGEKLDNLEAFHPDRMAGRILGMGDMVSLVEKAQQQFSEEEALNLQEKMAKGEFTFDDFLKQMQSMKNMGGMKSIMKLMPGMGQLGDLEVDDKEVNRMEAIVHSMTKEERRDPDVIDPSRRRRIARGSGTDQHDVSGLVKTFKQSRQMMQAVSGMGPLGKMKAMKSMMNPESMAAMMGGGGMPGTKVKQRSKRKKLPRRKRSKKHR